MHAGPKQVGEPAVQQYLWQARKKHDFKVPVKRASAGPDVDTYIAAAGVSPIGFHALHSIKPLWMLAYHKSGGSGISCKVVSL